MLKSLTVHQPWAWAIAAGHKRVENRSWATPYRGDLLIIAGRSRASLEAGNELLRSLGCWLPDGYVYGAAVCIVTLYAVLPLNELLKLYQPHPIATGPFCWMLSDARPLREPIPMTGHLSLRSVTSASVKTENLAST